jgi:hypothetical protein
MSSLHWRASRRDIRITQLSAGSLCLRGWLKQVSDGATFSLVSADSHRGGVLLATRSSGHGFHGHVAAALHGPFVVLLAQDGADQL